MVASLAKLSSSIGELHTPIQSQRWVDVPNGSGGFTGAWANQFQFWAKVLWFKGNEKVVGGQIQDFDYVYLVARYDDRLQAKDRIFIPGIPEAVNVRSVSDVEQRHRFLEIYGDRNVGT